MPSPRKRQHRQIKNGRVSTEAIEAFRANDWHGTYRALRLRPWEINPLDVGDYAEPKAEDKVYRERYDAAISLRRELLDALSA